MSELIPTAHQNTNVYNACRDRPCVLPYRLYVPTGCFLLGLYVPTDCFLLGHLGTNPEWRVDNDIVIAKKYPEEELIE